MPRQFLNCHVMITGGGGGIGLAAAQAFLAAAARCTSVDRAAQPPRAVEELQQQYPATLAYAGADLTDIAAIAPLVEAAVARFGPVHTLMNNAAVFELAPLLEATEASLDMRFSRFFERSTATASPISSTACASTAPATC